MAVVIKRAQVSWNNDNNVIVKNAELIEALISDKEETIAAISKEVSPLTLDMISVDEHGTVIIKDPAFRAKVESLMAEPNKIVTADNHVCGWGCTH